MIFEHKSVLLDEIIDNLSIKEDGTYVDATLGGAGHAFEVCRHLSEKGHFIGIDQDEDAIESSKLRLKRLYGQSRYSKEQLCKYKKHT